MLKGQKAFELHDTHGLPIEMTYLECKERGISVDMLGFAVCALNAGWKKRRLLALVSEGWMTEQEANDIKGLA